MKNFIQNCLVATVAVFGVASARAQAESPERLACYSVVREQSRYFNASAQAGAVCDDLREAGLAGTEDYDRAGDYFWDTLGRYYDAQDRCFDLCSAVGIARFCSDPALDTASCN